MIDTVRNAVEHVGLSLEAAVRHASTIPARILGVADRKGALEPGMDADIVLLRSHPRLDVEATICAGDVAFTSPPGSTPAG
jgi:N-acetylglucosamine-6-phosphate deacetylase